jgi:Glycosyl hydrolase catalytic core
VLFLNQTQSFMDNAPWVERYAWFGAMKNLNGVNQVRSTLVYPVDRKSCAGPFLQDNALMDGNGNINALGRQYIGEEGSLPSGSVGANGPSGSCTLLGEWLFLMGMVFATFFVVDW